MHIQRSPFIFGSDQSLTWEEWLEDLRGFVANSRSEIGLTHKQLARETNLLVITLERFADGTTRRPHARTIGEICRTFLALRRTTAPDEITKVNFNQKQRASERNRHVIRRKRDETPVWKKRMARRLRRTGH